MHAQSMGLHSHSMSVIDKTKFTGRLTIDRLGKPHMHNVEDQMLEIIKRFNARNSDNRSYGEHGGTRRRVHIFDTSFRAARK